jgi:hypothetical protein
MFVEALNSHLDLQRYKILHVCGNYSRVIWIDEISADMA